MKLNDMYFITCEEFNIDTDPLVFTSNLTKSQTIIRYLFKCIFIFGVSTIGILFGYGLWSFIILICLIQGIDLR